VYWHLLSRAVERGQHTFDFGRSSKDSGTYRFKAQWGATESPAVWQHYVREGSASDMRPNSVKYDLMINAWQKLPVWLTKLIGPSIVRGIP
jgi:serine/alanine adding enzyme